MLGILLDDWVGLPKQEFLLRRRESLATHAYCEKSGSWMGDEGVKWSGIREFVEKGYDRPPNINHFFLVWAIPDDRFLEALRFFSRQTEIKLCITVILIGPLQPGNIDHLNQDLTTIFPKSEGSNAAEAGPSFSTRTIRAIWMLGNESTDRKAVSPQQRLDAARALINVLNAGGVKAATDLDFDPTANLVEPWSFFGCLSLLPIPGDLRELRKKLAQAILRELIEKDLGRKERIDEIRSFSGMPDNDVKELLTFGLDGHCPVGQWPSPYLNIFAHWFCPTWEWMAKRRLEHALEHDYREVEKYVHQLRNELRGHALDIRKEGQALYAARVERLHNWLKDCGSLAIIALLLEHYFTAFALLDDKVSQENRTPCAPAGTPSDDALKRLFVAELWGIYQKHNQRLIGIKEASIFGVTALGALAVAFLLWRFGFGWTFILALPGVWSVVFLVRWIKALLAGREMQRDLIEHRKKQISALHQAFCDKIKRVRVLTRKTIALQFISQNRRIGERMMKMFGSFFGKWTEFSRSEGLPERQSVRAMLARMGIGTRVIESAEQRVADVGAQLMELSIKGEDGVEAINRTFDIFDDNFHGSIDLGAKPVRVVESQKQIQEAWEKSGVPVLARLGIGDLQRDIFRLAFLPQDEEYDSAETALNGITLPISVHPSIYRISLTAPVVFEVRAGMELELVRAALLTTEVKR